MGNMLGGNPEMSSNT